MPNDLVGDERSERGSSDGWTYERRRWRRLRWTNFADNQRFLTERRWLEEFDTDVLSVDERLDHLRLTYDIRIGIVEELVGSNESLVIGVGRRIFVRLIAGFDLLKSETSRDILVRIGLRRSVLVVAQSRSSPVLDIDRRR